MVNPQSLVGIAVSLAIASIVIIGVAIPILNSLNTDTLDDMSQVVYGFIATFLILALLIGAIAGTGLVNIG